MSRLMHCHAVISDRQQRAVQGAATNEPVKQHLCTALSLIGDLVVDAELEARIQELQPLKLRTLRDVQAGLLADGKSIEELPLNGHKKKCASVIAHVWHETRCRLPGGHVVFAKPTVNRMPRNDGHL